MYPIRRRSSRARGGEAGHVPAEDKDLSPSGDLLPQDELEEEGLPGRGRADHEHEPISGDAEGETIQDEHPVVGRVP